MGRLSAARRQGPQMDVPRPRPRASGGLLPTDRASEAGRPWQRGRDRSSGRRRSRGRPIHARADHQGSLILRLVFVAVDARVNTESEPPNRRHRSSAPSEVSD